MSRDECAAATNWQATAEEQYACIEEVAESLRSALHHHKIDRNIAGWQEVKGALAVLGDVLHPEEAS